jgi:hypothetical protein
MKTPGPITRPGAGVVCCRAYGDGDADSVPSDSDGAAESVTTSEPPGELLAGEQAARTAPRARMAIRRLNMG